MQWQLQGNRPIYQQIMERITEQIVSGQLSPGEKVPAVRELAAEAGVNPNTMQRALADMEREGLLYTNRTSGRYVTEDVIMIQKVREQIADKRIAEFLVGMTQLGFSKPEIIARLDSLEVPAENQPSYPNSNNKSKEEVTYGTVRK